MGRLTPRHVCALLTAAVFSASIAAAASATPVAAAEAVYQISVKTATDKNAGTNANVTIRLHGSLASSNELVLNNRGDDRTRGKLDVYKKSVPKDLGRIWKVDLRSDGSGEKPTWRVNYVEVSKVGSPLESRFNFFKKCKVCDLNAEAEDFDATAWVKDSPGSFTERSFKSVVKYYDNLDSSQPTRQTRSFTHKITDQIQASTRVTEESDIRANMGWKSPSTVIGQFSAGFQSAWKDKLETEKARLTREELTLKTTVKFTVPPKRLWLSKVIWEGEWQGGMVQAGGEDSALRWLLSQPDVAAEVNATLKFGKPVPKQWRAWIRAHLPKYVPPKLRNKKGPFKLYEPGSR